MLRISCACAPHTAVSESHGPDHRPQSPQLGALCSRAERKPPSKRPVRPRHTPAREHSRTRVVQAQGSPRSVFTWSMCVTSPAHDGLCGAYHRNASKRHNMTRQTESRGAGRRPAACTCCAGASPCA
eukprot:420057-Rhodomonas_salina.1